MSSNHLGDILKRYVGGLALQRKPISVERRARDLVKAIDAGGLPLNPFIVNDIARQMGLDVAVNEPMMVTIGRIREALERT